MKRHSCGAILYTKYQGKVYIVLGMELKEWFPFKGTRNKGETNEQTAIREIYEETCGVVKLSDIILGCNFSTKRKHYHIGLAYISPKQVNQFYTNIRTLTKKTQPEDYNAFLEKTDIKLFPIDTIFNWDFHEITRIPILHYLNTLRCIQSAQARCSPISHQISNTPLDVVPLFGL